MKTIYQAVTLFLWTALAVAHCPTQSNIAPCTCDDIKDGISVRCKGPEDRERIVSAIRNIRSSQNWELVLESLNLPVLPDSVREVSSLRLYNVQIERVSNSSAFTWSKLYDLVIESSTVLENPWQHLKDAKHLRHLKVSGMEVPKIGADFREGVPDGVAYLDIRKTQTSELESNAMGRLNKLRYLLMVDIPLIEFPRDVLPPEMPELHTFILGNTKIEKLEPGFFGGMPKLEVLMLNGNSLVTLEFNLFSPVKDHLTHLLAERNPLICDCDLIWLTKNVQKKESMKVLATCTDNETHTRKEVTRLDVDRYCS